MRIAFFSNYINHHQVSVADELYRLTGSNYVFVENCPMSDERKKLGYPDFSDRPYIIKAYLGGEEQKRAMKEAETADVMIMGNTPLMYKEARLRKGLLTFDYSERVLKRGLLNVFSKYNRETIRLYHRYKSAPFYKLCASAYVANDMETLHIFKDRCFKWGYFPELEDIDISKKTTLRKGDKVRMLWCARTLNWKHPEMVIQLAERLDKTDYNYEIDMICAGENLEQIKEMAEKCERVNIMKSVPNEEVLKQMRTHDIFLFTSDKREGWGVVLNEAMSQGCCPVVSDMVGAAPFLVENGNNGLLFRSESIESLTQQVMRLLDNPSEISRMGSNAYATMRDKWSYKIAAERLYKLCEGLLNGEEVFFEDGPCSKATPTKRTIQ